MKNLIIKIAFLSLIIVTLSCRSNERSSLTFVKADYQLMLPINNLISEETIHTPAVEKKITTPVQAIQKNENPTVLSEEGFKYYIVKKNDTLFLIAEKIFGNGKRWHELYLKNKRQNWRKDPDWLEVGLKIYYK